MFCDKCGNNLEEGAMFCDKCGSSVKRKENTSAFSSERQEFSQTGSVEDDLGILQLKKKLSKKQLITIAISVIVAIIVIIAVSVGAGKQNSKLDFVGIYSQYCNGSWAEYGDDGSYLRIDTNPYDYEDEGMYYSSAYYAIEKVNLALGLPSSLFVEMGETTWSMGKQIKNYENLVVSWTYHPDKGLEVLYSIS